MEERLKRSKFEVVVTYIFVGLVTLSFLLPLLWVFRTSLITKFEAYQLPPSWNVKYTLDNYIKLLVENEFGSYFFTSLGIAFITTLIGVACGAMASYWIVRCAKRKNVIKIAILTSQLIPPIVLVVPLVVIMKQIGIDDSWYALIIANLSYALPYVIWMMVSFFESVPVDLDEACEIDGCTKTQTFFQVALPLAAPGIVSTAVYCFINVWNEFLFALMLTGNNTKTLSVAIAGFESSKGTAIAEMSAATMIAIIPISLISIFIKKYLVSGLTSGSVK